jgi:hypothetical protein
VSDDHFCGWQGGKDGRAQQPVYEDENLRAYYQGRPGLSSWHSWKGLALGASAEGIAYAAGRPIMRPGAAGPLHCLMRCTCCAASMILKEGHNCRMVLLPVRAGCTACLLEWHA